MSENKKYHYGPWVVGLLLLALGTVWILTNFGIVDFRINSWWPLLLIVIGVLYLVFSRRIIAPGGWILIFLGVLSFLTTNEILKQEEVWKFWPAILVFIGLYTILRMYLRDKHEPPEDEVEVEEDEDVDPPGADRIRGASVMGGITRKITSKAFKGGSFHTVFGGAYLNLRSAGLYKEGAILDLSATFGGITIRLPKTWPVEIRPTAILGGVTTRNANDEKTKGKRMIINASAIVGGITILN